jgi:hypothetical protein
VASECYFPAPGRAKRRKREGEVSSGKERESELLARLRKLEGLVESLSGEVEEAKNEARLDENGTWLSTGAGIPSGDREGEKRDKVRVGGTEDKNKTKKVMYNEQSCPEVGRLVIDEGKSRYISNSFWAGLAGEASPSSLHRATY